MTLSPLDGRYRSKIDALLPFFSEEALNRARLEVEIRYFIALSNIKGVQELPPVTQKQQKALLGILDTWNDREAAAVKAIEKTTNHDVKAVEYYLKKRVGKIPGLQNAVEFIHFGLTSEDVNNLAYGMLIHGALRTVIIPSLHATAAQIRKQAKSLQKTQMLSLTHGQPATPTTLGKELMVFVDRLSRQIDQLKGFRMQGKLGGAVGNFSAHYAAYPHVKWEALRTKFVRSLGLIPLENTTQINPHDDIAQLSHTFARINTIGIDLSRDMWSYISRGIFRQKVIAGEVGSSAMPHKVNPIDFENAEGNLGLSTALFLHFAEKLPVSRLQRDLSDSTVQRNIGVAFGYHLLALQSLQKGLSKLQIDRAAVSTELAGHPEVLAEAIQTVMRRYGVQGAYEKMKELTRGEKVTREQLQSFVGTLSIPQEAKERLMKMIG